MTGKIKIARIENNIAANAIHSTVEGEIAAIAKKASPVSVNKPISEFTLRAHQMLSAVLCYSLPQLIRIDNG